MSPILLHELVGVLRCIAHSWSEGKPRTLDGLIDCLDVQKTGGRRYKETNHSGNALAERQRLIAPYFTA
jgi:hypothetical protein